MVILSIFLFQKYRLYLNRVKPNSLGDASERQNSSMDNQRNFMHNHEHERWHVSSCGIPSWSPNYFGATSQLGQLMDSQSILCMGALIHGGRMSRYLVPRTLDARRFAGSEDPPINLDNGILDDIMLDEFSSYSSSTSYIDSMRGKLMETSKGKTPSNLRSYFTYTPSGRGSSAPTNEYQVQPLESINHYHTHMNAPYTHMLGIVGSCSNFQGFARNYNNPRRSSMQVNFPGILHRGGTSHVPPCVNIPRINQLTNYETSSSGLLLQNQLPLFIGNTISVTGFNEQIVPFNIPTNPSSVGMLNAHNSTPMAPSQMFSGGRITTLRESFNEKISPFNIASNTSSIGTMLSGNSALGIGSTSKTETNMVNSQRTISTVSNLQTDSFVALTPMPDGGDAAGILPVQESMVNQQEPNDLVKDINAFSSDDIANLLNDDFIGEDAVMNG
ncbi:hypothetical protein ACQJBY_039525 [Aegilops geniculata]